ncbi:Rrf2 family transcriptional regulator [Halalkalibacillus sediminis]|uniref:HTH-type transcriptional regulator NsrR n=1 Tax=Halalkalibacillus sediminis TaxID=2018042 RepID=A0A2I0QVL9_9BACI|nr:Rrf2 family transcriptional regulator [Halalkalibacillus sediminis]PKR78391.1 Rrf2 family transcriptional regulator [Halalkalibacillus sediminis]
MKLKKYTDYALRVLIYTASVPDGELANKKDISKVFHISENHIGKIVHELNKAEILQTIRGRSGGIKLSKHPSEINIGQVVRLMEGDFEMFECFSKDDNYCIITPACKLKNIVNVALKEFLKVIDQYTLEDLLENKSELQNLMEVDN